MSVGVRGGRSGFARDRRRPRSASTYCPATAGVLQDPLTQEPEQQSGSAVHALPSAMQAHWNNEGVPVEFW